MPASRALAALFSLVVTLLCSAQTLGEQLNCPISPCRITREFGYELANGHRHTGIDLNQTPGTYGDIVAAADGTVVRTVPEAETPGLGNVVVLRHDEGTPQEFFTLYGHLANEAGANAPFFVAVGQSVTGGVTKIGRTGETGAPGQPHTHFEVKYRSDVSMPTDANPAHFGYTQIPGLLPNRAGYENPYPLLFGTFVDLPPTVVSADQVNAATSPIIGDDEDPSDSDLEESGWASMGYVEVGQQFVARRQMGNWKLVDTASWEGPQTAWIVASATHGGAIYEVTTDYLNVRNSAGGSVVSRLWSGQRIAGVPDGNAGTGGCTGEWVKFDLMTTEAGDPVPEDETVGWTCSDYLLANQCPLPSSSSSGFSATSSTTCPCSYQLAPTSRSHGSASVPSATFNVLTEPGCSWSAATSDTWLFPLGSGTGNGSVLYSVLENQTTIPRTGFITVGNATFEVNQAGATSNPFIGFNPTSLAPATTTGQNAPSQQFSVWNGGSGTLSYSITDNASWLSASPASGTSLGEADAIGVNYSTSSLPTGVYAATITISDPSASNSPQTIDVTLTVSAAAQPTIALSTSTLTPTATEGANAAGSTFDVWNSGSGTLNFSIVENGNWITSVTPSSGASMGPPVQVALGYATSSLAPGTYGATVTVSDPAASNSPQTVNVTLTVEAQVLPPTVTLTATPAVISAGESSTIAWDSTGATGCVASGAWSGAAGTGGSTVVSPASTATYVLECTGPGGTTARNLTLVVVPPAPEVSLVAQPAVIAPGDSTTLTWTATDASECAASESWSGTRSTSGNEVVSPSVQSTYTLTCTGGGGLGSASVTVDVVPPGVVFVNQNAAGLETGGSWTDAFTDLQDGLDAAAPVGDEVWVAAGTYKPTAGLDRAATFQLASGVEVYGGFVGFEAARNQRDVDGNPTILTGDLLADDGQDFSGYSDNSYNVVSGGSVDATAVLDGFTIRGGNANGSSPHNVGGGIRLFSGDAPTLANLVLVGNYSNVVGGAMIVASGSSPLLENVDFIDNRAQYQGGAVYSTGSPVLRDVLFLKNVSQGECGGGITVDAGSARLTNVRFIGNDAQLGGGLCALAATSVVNAVFSGNDAADHGGGAYVIGSATEFSNATFGGNTAGGLGGGIHAGFGIILGNTILWGNADSGGFDESAQIHLVSGQPFVSYSIVEGWSGSLGGSGNSGSDPLFLNPAGADGTVGTEDDDVRLAPGSPGIDAGSNLEVPADLDDLDGDADTGEPIPHDLDGVPRFANDPGSADVGQGTPPIVDLGAYEVQAPPCSDGLDNDNDGNIDFPDDVGCRDATWGTESPQCSDGINNDPGQDPNPGLIDFDGGQSIHGICSGGTCPPGVSDPDLDGIADPDPQCSSAWKNRESAGRRCGLGFELVAVLPLLVWSSRRRRFGAARARR